MLTKQHTSRNWKKIRLVGTEAYNLVITFAVPDGTNNKCNILPALIRAEIGKK
jgi:hypothetical protein